MATIRRASRRASGVEIRHPTYWLAANVGCRITATRPTGRASGVGLPPPDLRATAGQHAVDHAVDVAGVHYVVAVEVAIQDIAVRELRLVPGWVDGREHPRA